MKPRVQLNPHKLSHGTNITITWAEGWIAAIKYLSEPCTEHYKPSSDDPAKFVITRRECDQCWKAIQE